MDYKCHIKIHTKNKIKIYKMLKQLNTENVEAFEALKIRFKRVSQYISSKY